MTQFLMAMLQGPDAKKRKLDGDSSSATVPCNKVWFLLVLNRLAPEDGFLGIHIFC
jgi:hypothetical protein